MSAEISDPTGTRTTDGARSRAASNTRSAATPAAVPPPIRGGDDRRSAFWRVYTAVAQLIDQKVGWDKLPRLPGLAVIVGLRTILRQRNLVDPSTRVPIVGGPTVEPRTAKHLVSRSVDGSYNDLDHPDMGMAGMRFGRTVIHLMRQGVLTEDQGVAIARTVNDPDVHLDHLPW